MPKFAFKAKNIQGKFIKGSLEAENDLEARVKLRSQHLIPVKLKLEASKVKVDFLSFDFLKNRGISSKELQNMTRQFSTLIDAGIPILQSISILTQSTRNKNLKETLGNVSSSIQNGSDLSDALAANSHIFDTSYVNMVRAGEAGGLLDTSLKRISDHIESVEKLKGKVKAALWYPAVVITISIVVIGIMMVYVIPQFEELFASSGTEIPGMTQMVINISHFIQNFWYLIFLAIFAIIIGIIMFYKSAYGRKIMDTLFIGLPILGPLIQKNSLARSCRTFASMLSSGVFVLESLDISANTAGNHLITEALKSAKASVIEGESLTIPLAKNKYIPNMVVQMIGIGEQTGSLDMLMDKVATFYEEEVEYGVSGLTDIMEPVLIVVLGIIIGFIVVCMYLPIFQLGEGI